VGTEGLINAAGSDAEGVIITQVVPPYDRVDLPTIQLYRKALDKYMFGTSPSFVSLEGFVDAMVLVEGLEAAGKDLTRAKFIAASSHSTTRTWGLARTFASTTVRKTTRASIPSIRPSFARATR